MGNVKELYSGKEWVACCPECGWEVFYLVVDNPNVGNLIRIRCGNEECLYEYDVKGPRIMD